MSDPYRTPPKRWWQSPDGEMIVDLDAIEAVDINPRNENWPLTVYFRSGHRRAYAEDLLTAFKIYRGIP